MNSKHSAYTGSEKEERKKSEEHFQGGLEGLQMLFC